MPAGLQPAGIFPYAGEAETQASQPVQRVSADRSAEFGRRRLSAPAGASVGSGR
jgi:hypothetical protein